MKNSDGRKTVLFVMFMEHSHVVSTFGIAADLKEQGVNVLYLCNPGWAEKIRARGFEPVVFDLQIPYEDIPCNPDRPLPRQIVHNEAIMWIVALEKACFRSQLFQELLAEHGVDCLAVDEHLSVAALVAYELGIPTVTISIYLSCHYYGWCAPSNFYLPPFRDERARHRFETEEWVGRKQFIKELSITRIEFVEKFLATSRYPKAEVSDETSHYPWLRLVPNLILVSRHFQYPRDAGNGAPRSDDTEIYCGPCLDVTMFPARAEDTPGGDCAPQEEVGNPLIVVSFGSQTSRYPLLAETMQTLVDCFAEHPQWRVVMSCGDRLAPIKAYIAEKHGSAPNVECEAWIDQKQLMTQASVLVTHGGIQSVKEAVYYRVPLLVIPQAFDQFGNAARVEFHGVGKSVIPDAASLENCTGYVAEWFKSAITPPIRQSDGITAAKIASCLSELLVSNSSFKQNISEMSRKSAIEQKDQLAARLIVEKMENPQKK